MHRTSFQRLAGPDASIGQRILVGISGVLALVITMGLLVAGFFLAMALLGLAALVAVIWWVRNRWARWRGTSRATRQPVIIEGDYVVLERRPPR